MSQKDLHVESRRGLAIILLLLFHIGHHMHYEIDNVINHIFVPFKYLRMPLFTVISGYVYAMKPLRLGEESLFIKKKLRRLVLPLLSWSTLTYLVWAPTFGEFALTSPKELWFMPFLQFWFLQTMVLIFFITIVLERTRIIQSLKGWLVTLLLFVGLTSIWPLFLPFEWVFPPNQKVFMSWNGIIYLMPYFLLGLGLKRFFDRPMKSYGLWLLGIIALTGGVVQELIFHHKISSHWLNWDQVGGVFFGIASTIWVMKTRWRSKWLSDIGQYAYPIYLTHTIFVLVLNQFALKIARRTYIDFIDSVDYYIAFSFLIGSVCLGLSILLNKSPVTRLLLLGKSPHGSASNVEPNQGIQIEVQPTVSVSSGISNGVQ